MSQLQKQNAGVWPDGPKQERVKGKDVSPKSGTFKTGAILSKLPSHQPLDSGGVSEKNFQDLRNSTIKKGSI